MRRSSPHGRLARATLAIACAMPALATAHPLQPGPAGGESRLHLSRDGMPPERAVVQAPAGFVFARVTSGDIVADGGWSFGHGWGDADGDGCIDLFVCNIVGGGTNFFYRNECDGTFTKIAGVPPAEGGPSTSPTWGDYDNDGDPDLFVANGGTAGPAVNALYENRGDGSFRRITQGVLVAQALASTATSWVDVDNDGLLDLFVGRAGGSNELFLNAGDGSFVRAPMPAGGGTWGVAWADYDNDGDLDVFGANWGVANILYRNDNGTLVRVANGPIVEGSHNTVSGSWGDYDNDGDMDLFVANSSARDRLFRNEGEGSFVEVTEAPMLIAPGNSEGSCWADFDHDGDLDLLVAAGGNVSFGFIGLYENLGDGGFAEITAGELVELSGRFEGTSCIDYDNDGDLDVFASNYAGRDNVLFRNDGSLGSWLSVRCEGVESNRSAIGTRVRVLATIDGEPTWQTREVVAHSGHVAQGDLRLHFGLGDAERADVVRIVWPSGVEDELTDVNANTFLHVVEGAHPTPISMHDLSADSRTDGVHLSWRLAGPIAREMAGVHVQRADVIGQGYETITLAPLVPAARMAYVDHEAASDEAYWYRLVLDFLDGARVLTRAVRGVGPQGAHAIATLKIVHGDDDGLRVHYALMQPATPVRLEVFDVKGRRLRVLEESTLPAGEYVSEWDGLDELGNEAPRGVYIVRMQAGSSVLARKATMTRR